MDSSSEGEGSEESLGSLIGSQLFSSWLFGGSDRIELLREALLAPAPTAVFNIGKRASAAVATERCVSAHEWIC